MQRIFKSSRLSPGNTVFPISVMIDDSNFYYSKGFVPGRIWTIIPRRNIVSVSLTKRLLFSDLAVESRGGHILHLEGFSHADARAICLLLSGAEQRWR